MLDSYKSYVLPQRLVMMLLLHSLVLRSVSFTIITIYEGAPASTCWISKQTLESRNYIHLGVREDYRQLEVTDNELVCSAVAGPGGSNCCCPGCGKW